MFDTPAKLAGWAIVAFIAWHYRAQIGAALSKVFRVGPARPAAELPEADETFKAFAALRKRAIDSNCPLAKKKIDELLVPLFGCSDKPAPAPPPAATP